MPGAHVIRYLIGGFVATALAATGAPAPAAETGSLGRCVALEVGKTLVPIPLYLPVDGARARLMQKVGDSMLKVAGDVAGLDNGFEMLLTMKEDEARGLRGSEVKPFTTEVCYQRALGDLKTFVAAFDTTVPDTRPFWPTLADGWDAGATCRAYEKLEKGIATIDSWLGEIDARIATLDGYKSGLDRLGRASTRLGRGMLDAADRVKTHGWFGGLVAWYSLTELTGYGLYFSGEIHDDISAAAGAVDGKLKEVGAVRGKLEEERGKLRESADVLKLKHGATNCSRRMEDLVAEKEKADRLEIMDMAVEAKLNADGRYHEGGSGSGSSDAFGEFLGGFLQGLAGAGSVGMPGGGGAPNAGCAQVRAQIRSDRNYLAQAGAPATSYHRAAFEAARRRHDQNVAWYNRNCT